MGELAIRWLTLVYTICLYSARRLGNIQSFNSISKISYVRNSKLFFRTAVQENTTVCSVILHTPSGPSIDTTASQAPIAPILKTTC
jgi:hypothetical protein